MDGLKKLLIGNKLNHLTTSRILTRHTRFNRKNTKQTAVDENVFVVLLGESRQMLLRAGK